LKLLCNAKVAKTKSNGVKLQVTS